jgi:transcription elongation factor GreB
MSKAFTREDDDAPERPPAARPAPALPAGVKNYLTPDGHRRLREELDLLVTRERPRLGALPDPAAARQQLDALDLRVGHLQQCLRTAVIVPPPERPWDRVRFGAEVTVREQAGTQARYRIVGLDESDPERGWVSFISPLARALLGARRGQKLRLQLPAGAEELEILDITYPPAVAPAADDPTR